MTATAGSTDGFLEFRAHGHAGVDGKAWELVERARPTFSGSFGERVTLNTTLEIGLHQGRTAQQELKRTLEESKFGPVLDAAGCTWPEQNNQALSISRATDYMQVDRLFLDIYLPQVDLRIGRQALNWGSAQIINPTAPFPQVLATEPWRPRAGVNAIRATIPLGESHQTQLVIGARDDFKALRVASRTTFGVGLADISLVGAWRQETEDGIVGVDIRGTFGVGYWLEAAARIDGDGAHESIVAGIDYSFPVGEQLVVTLQYHRNGEGSASVGPAGGSFNGAIRGPTCAGGVSPLGSTDAEPDPFAPFFRGLDYGIAAISFAATEELSMSGLWLQNLRDATALAVPTLAWVPNGWFELAAAAQLPVDLGGDGGELSPSPDDLVLDANGTKVDLSGLVPAATFIVWTRLHY